MADSQITVEAANEFIRSQVQPQSVRLERTEDGKTRVTLVFPYHELRFKAKLEGFEMTDVFEDDPHFQCYYTEVDELELSARTGRLF